LLLIAAGRAAQMLLLLMMMRAASTYLPPDEMGRMALLNSSTALFALFLINPVGMFINRRLISWDAAGQIKHYFGIYYGYIVLVCLFVMALIVLSASLGLDASHTPIFWLVFLICGSLLINTINQTLIPSLNLLGFSAWFMGLTLGTIATGFLLAVLFSEVFKPSAELWLAGLLAGQLLFAGLGARVFYGKIQSKPVERSGLSRAHINMLFMFAWPVMLAAGLNWLQTQGYRFFMSQSLGLSALGLFVAGYGLSAGLISGVETILTTYFQPRFYRSVNEEKSGAHAIAWNVYANAIIPSVLLFVVFVAVVAPQITRLLLGPQYASSAQYVVWGALAEATRVVVSVYAMAAHAKMRTTWLLWPNVTGAILAVVLVACMVPGFGAVGAGIALTATGLALIVMWHVKLRKEMQISLAWRRIFKGICMGGALACCAVLLRTPLQGFAEPVSALAMLALSGVLLLGMQYFLLRDQIITTGRDGLQEAQPNG
jgi:O-antigen/teichoic acid export membrane protein